MDNNSPPNFNPPTGNKSANYQPAKYKVPCPYGCLRLFVCQHNVDQHVREKHTGEKPYCCYFPNCKSCFPRPWSLSRHLRLVHKVDNQVSKCGKGKKAKAEMGQLNHQMEEMLGPAGQAPYVPAFDHELPADVIFRPADDAHLHHEEPAQPNYMGFTSFYDLPALPYDQPPAPHQQTNAGTSHRLLDPALTAANAYAPPNNAVQFEQAAANRDNDADVRHHCPFCIATFERPAVLAKHFHKRHGMAPHPDCTCEDCVVLFAAHSVQQYGDQATGAAHVGLNGAGFPQSDYGSMPLLGDDLFKAQLDVGAPSAGFNMDAVVADAAEQVHPAALVEENCVVGEAGFDSFDINEMDLAYLDPAHYDVEEWLADAEATQGSWAGEHADKEYR